MGKLSISSVMFNIEETCYINYQKVIKAMKGDDFPYENQDSQASVAGFGHYDLSMRLLVGSSLARPSADGTAGSAATIADCTAESRPFPVIFLHRGAMTFINMGDHPGSPCYWGLNAC